MDLRDTFWKLKQEDLIHEYVTIMTRDTQRAVVNLSTIHTIEITHLCGALGDLIRGDRRSGLPVKPNECQPWILSEFADFMTWKIRCWEGSSDSGLSLVPKTLMPLSDFRTELPSKRPEQLSLLVELVELILQTLDIALIAHMSAHVSHDESVLLHSRVPQISLPLNSADSSDHRVLHFEPHQLACLSGLTGFRPTWVLQRLDQKADERFYLSASIENFALIWSPVWKVPLGKEGLTFRQYNVGGGSIVPWKYMLDLHPPLYDNERLCHWTRQEYDENARSWNESSHESNETTMDEVQVRQDKKSLLRGLNVFLLEYCTIRDSNGPHETARLGNSRRE